MCIHSVSSYRYIFSSTFVQIFKKSWWIHFSTQLILHHRAKCKTSDILKWVTKMSRLGIIKCSLATCCHINYGVQHQFSLLCHEPTLSPFYGANLWMIWYPKCALILLCSRVLWALFLSPYFRSSPRGCYYPSLLVAAINDWNGQVSEKILFVPFNIHSC